MTERIVIASTVLLAIVCVGCEWSHEPLGPPLPKEFIELREKSRRVPDAVRDVLDNADRFALFSVEGEDQPPDITSETKFHGFDVLGKVDIEDAEERKALVEALYQGIAESTQPAICFFPRHGIRASHGGPTVDLLICFECMHMKIIAGGERDVWTSGKPAAAFNEALTRHNVRLASPPGAK